MKTGQSRKSRALILFAVGISAALRPCATYAGLGSDVQGFFNDINFGNVTQPGVYEGQTAGYFTGGSIYARTPVRNYQLVNIQMPTFRAGCGGIDLFSGGFSFINSDQFVAMLRNIGSNAESLAFMLALQVVSPQIKGVLADINDWAQKFNQSQINSCQTAGVALGGALSLFGADEQSCVVQRVSSQGEDYATADAACRSNPNNTGGTAAKTSFTKGNLAWKAMMKINYFQNDTDLSQAVMNLTGTLIVTDDGSSNPAPTTRRVASLLSSSVDTSTGSLVDVLLHGGTAQIYQCSDATATDADTSCITVGTSPSNVTISNTQALVPQVSALLSSIVDKIQTDTALNAQEIGLIRSTTLPVYKYLTVSAALLGANANTDVVKYSEIVTKDLLYAYLLDLIKKVNDGASQIAIQSQQDMVKAFQDDIRDARRAIAAEDAKTTNDYTAALQLTTAARDYERTLVGALSPAVMQSALFQSRQ